MQKQKGATLVTALVLMTIITLVAVYSLEGSSIQSKMVANSLFSTLTYQECRNEQEANIRFYNEDSGSARDTLLDIRQLPADPDTGNPTLKTVGGITSQNANYTPKSDLTIAWAYISEAPAAKGGNEVDIKSQIRSYQFEHDCIANFRFASNSQTLGAIVEGLQSAGNIAEGE